MGNDGYFASLLLKLGVAGAEERVQSVEFLGQAFSNLQKEKELILLENQEKQATRVFEHQPSGSIIHLISVERAGVIHDVHGTAVQKVPQPPHLIWRDGVYCVYRNSSVCI